MTCALCDCNTGGSPNAPAILGVPTSPPTLCTTRSPTRDIFWAKIVHHRPSRKQVIKEDREGFFKVLTPTFKGATTSSRMSLPNVLPGESVVMPEVKGMPLYVQVIVGLCITIIAVFFLLVIYAMIKNRRIVYCDVMKLHKEIMAAVLGTGAGHAGGRDLRQEADTTKGGHAGGKAPLLQQVVIQGKGGAWIATCASPEHKLLNGSNSIV